MEEEENKETQRGKRLRIQWVPSTHDSLIIAKKAKQFDSPSVGAATVVGMVMKKAIKGTLVDKDTGKGFFEENGSDRGTDAPQTKIPSK